LQMNQSDSNTKPRVARHVRSFTEAVSVQRSLAIALITCAAACNTSKQSEPSAAVGSASAKPAVVSAAPSGSSVPQMAHGVPLDPEKIQRVVNPKHASPYTGPMGTVAGTVAMTGDPALPRPEWVKDVPKDCLAARETYGTVFREGMMRMVADVFVAVTFYDGYVPAATDQKLVAAKGCAFNTRTIGLTYGQALDIVSEDARAYVPELMGGKAHVQLVVTPGGKPVRLYPERPGRYLLVDSMRTFATAEVFVVAYSTFDVTGLDGKFEIKNVPAGKVKLNALLPAGQLSTEKEVTVEAGKTTTVQLELRFDREAYLKSEKELEQRRKTQSAGATTPGAPSSQP